VTEYTPNVAIPYPSTTDSACTVAAEMLAAAGVIDAVMLVVEARIDVKINPQVFRVSLTNGSTVLNADYVNAFGVAGDERRIPFDTVDFDPEGVVDLVRDNTTVTLDRGLIFVGVSGGVDGMTANTTHYLYVREGYDRKHASVATNGVTDAASGNMAIALWDNTSAGASIYSEFHCTATTTSGTANGLTMWGARLCGIEEV
jgi:hypothetical protein